MIFFCVSLFSFSSSFSFFLSLSLPSRALYSSIQIFLYHRFLVIVTASGFWWWTNKFQFKQNSVLHLLLFSFRQNPEVNVIVPSLSLGLFFLELSARATTQKFCNNHYFSSLVWKRISSACTTETNSTMFKIMCAWYAFVCDCDSACNYV